ncbi:hypothetical protein [Bradyrhizobium sp.]|uniref:hypothetical protein n=1 Tax=Bradyrhizobium sp. TaxID=376 RepID=UPI003C3586F7
MTTIVFDDAGRGWDEESLELRRRLHCHRPDFNLTTYLIDNLGFIALSWKQHGACTIRLRPALASSIGLAAALFALADLAPQRVIVSHPSETCGLELFANVGRAVARIEELVADARQPTCPAFLKREVSLEAQLQAGGPLAALLRYWANADQAYEPEKLRALLYGALRGRFVVVEPNADRRHLTIMDIGPGFVVYDKSWLRIARGLPMEHQPDYAYGRWARGAFDQALERTQACVDDVDAVIARPSLNDTIRAQYRRVVLPFRRGPSGSPCLLSASIVDDVDLRRAARGALS